MRGYRERTIRTFKELRAALEHLDSDAGIRIKSSLKEFNDGGFIFISKSGEVFTINICDSIKCSNGILIAGGKEKWLYLKSVDEVMDFILKSAKRPLKAHLY